MADNGSNRDWTEKFPRLANAPIVEASISWQARAVDPIDEVSLNELMIRKLPNYPKIVPIKRFGWSAKMIDPSIAPVMEKVKPESEGFQCTTDDDVESIRITRDGVNFMRRKSYGRLEPFAAAALAAWQAYSAVAAPLEIGRVGVRFINHFPSATALTLGDFLKEPPSCPSNLVLTDFAYQSEFSVPEHRLGVRVVKILQSAGSGLILDCEAFTTGTIMVDNFEATLVLSQLRWLKNKVFFDLVNETQLDMIDKVQ